MAKKKTYIDPEVEIKAHGQEAETPPSLRVHIVKKGDTLRAIARDYLGDSRRIEEIRRANNLATDILTIGRELIIPDR